jgi:hypothetical protein
MTPHFQNFQFELIGFQPFQIFHFTDYGPIDFCLLSPNLRDHQKIFDQEEVEINLIDAMVIFFQIFYGSDRRLPQPIDLESANDKFLKPIEN